jgi:hypothetical protein
MTFPRHMQNEDEDCTLLVHLYLLAHKWMTSTDAKTRSASASQGVRIFCIHTSTHLNCAAARFNSIFQELFVFDGWG